MNAKALWGIIAILVILGGIYWLATSGTPEDTDITLRNGENADNTNGANSVNTTEAEGRVVFSITDAAANMSNISEVNMVVSKVEMYSEARGWVAVSTSPKGYNLLELDAKNQSKVLADAKVASDTYNQVRVTIDSVAVKTKAGATANAKVPSKIFTTNSKVVVSKDTTASVNMDFLADKSLHVTADNEYVFAPVVKTETKSNTTVTIDANGMVSISGGNSDSVSTSGMDVDGTVKANFELKTGVKLDVDANGVIKLQ